MMELEDFLQKVKDNNESEYSALLFNLYEDETAYTIEAVYGADFAIKNLLWKILMKTY